MITWNKKVALITRGFESGIPGLSFPLGVIP